MPIYNTYGNMRCKMKIGNLNLSHYELFDTVDVPDGVYICEEGTVIVQNGCLIAEYAPGQVLNFKGETVRIQAA